MGLSKRMSSWFGKPGARPEEKSDLTPSPTATDSSASEHRLTKHSHAPAKLSKPQRQPTQQQQQQQQQQRASVRVVSDSDSYPPFPAAPKPDRADRKNKRLSIVPELANTIQPRRGIRSSSMNHSVTTPSDIRPAEAGTNSPFSHSNNSTGNIQNQGTNQFPALPSAFDGQDQLTVSPFTVPLMPAATAEASVGEAFTAPTSPRPSSRAGSIREVWRSFSRPSSRPSSRGLLRQSSRPGSSKGSVFPDSTRPSPPNGPADEIPPSVDRHGQIPFVTLSESPALADDEVSEINALPFPPMPFNENMANRVRPSSSLPDISAAHSPELAQARRDSQIKIANRMSSLNLPIPGTGPSNNSDTSSIRSGKGRGNRKSWFSTVLSRSKEKEVPDMPSLPDCWELQPDTVSSADKGGADNRPVPYDLDRLLEGQIAPELWVSGADTDVHLFPGSRPVFRVPSDILVESRVLTSSCVPGSGDKSAPIVLYMPMGVQDGAITTIKQRVMATRNLFAFLMGKNLVASADCSTAVSVLASIAELLSALEFGDAVGNFGSVATASFEKVVTDLRLADVRASVVRTVDALVLAERFKSTRLYSEAFAHAVGMHEGLSRSPGLSNVSPATRTLLERGSFDVSSKVDDFESRFRDLQFRGLFAGVMTGKSSAGKIVSHSAWQAAFNEMRSFTISYLKARFGVWPPVRRNALPAITRMHALTIYSDFSALYDLLVDEKNKTTRKEGELSESVDAKSKSGPDNDRIIAALRRVLAEFDQSAPPVLPAMPYDAPKLPRLNGFEANSKASRSLFFRPKSASRRKLQSGSIPEVMAASYNSEVAGRSPEGSFVHSFLQMDARNSSGKSLSDLIQFRCGVWMFIYAVMQSLPIVVLDAAGVEYSKGVEYFLCQEAPISNPANVTPSYTIQSAMASVQAVMERSHPWVKAREIEERARAGPAPSQRDSSVNSTEENNARSLMTDTQSEQKLTSVSSNQSDLSSPGGGQPGSQSGSGLPKLGDMAGPKFNQPTAKFFFSSPESDAISARSPGQTDEGGRSSAAGLNRSRNESFRSGQSRQAGSPETASSPAASVSDRQETDSQGTMSPYGQGQSSDSLSYGYGYSYTPASVAAGQRYPNTRAQPFSIPPTPENRTISPLQEVVPNSPHGPLVTNGYGIVHDPSLIPMATSTPGMYVHSSASMPHLMAAQEQQSPAGKYGMGNDGAQQQQQQNYYQQQHHQFSQSQSPSLTKLAQLQLRNLQAQRGSAVRPGGVGLAAAHKASSSVNLVSSSSLAPGDGGQLRQVSMTFDDIFRKASIEPEAKAKEEAAAAATAAKRRSWWTGI